MEYLILCLLVILGTILLVCEVALIPGIGIVGVLGLASFASAVSYAFMVNGPLEGWITLIVVLIITVGLILWAIYGKTLDKMSLKKNITSTVKNPEAATLAVGSEGVTVARLALMGEVDFGGRVVEVKSNDGFIDEGVKVCIVKIASDMIYVKKAN